MWWWWLVSFVTVAGLIFIFARFELGSPWIPFALFGLVIFIIAMLSGRASARDLGQWTDTDPEISLYYKNLMMPDNPSVSCCGTADAYWADSFEATSDGEYVAIITDQRADEPLRRQHFDVGTKIIIPNRKLKFGPDDPQRDEANKNPTGHGIVFLSAGGAVYCYVAPGGV